MKNPAKKMKRLIRQTSNESELRYRHLFDRAKVGILILNAETGVIMDVNPYLIDMLGYLRQDFVEKILWEVNAFKDIEACQTILSELQTNDHFHNENLSLIAKDGRQIQVEFICNLYLVGDEKIIQCIIRDNIEPGQANAELERSNSLLEAALESTADGLLILDNHGKIASFNKKFNELWHIPQDILDSRDVEMTLGYAQNQLKDSDVFLSKVKELSARPEEESFDVLEFKDGHIIERYTCPQRIGEEIVGQVWSFRDITERKQGEEALIAERNLLRTLIDNMPDYIYAKDTESRFMLGNITMAHAMGATTPDELIGKTDNDFYPKELAAQYLNDEQEVIRMGQAMINREEIIIFPDGSQGFISTTKAPLRNQDGSVVGIVGISRDITARKQVEEALWAERNLLRTLIDNLPDSIYAKDTESRFVLGNVAVSRVMGAAAPDDLIGKTDYDFYPEELATQYFNDEQEVIRSGQALISREEPIIFPDGSQGFVSTTKVPLRNQDGLVVGIVGIGRDITGRKQVEEALWAERNLLRTLIDNLPDSIYAKDTESRFLLGNVAVARVMGAAAPDELIGKTDYDFFPEGLATQYYNDEQNVIRSGQAVISQEEPIIFPDGSQGFVSTTQVPLRNQDGSVVGLVGIGRDITGRKQAETKLIHMSTHDTMTGLFNRTYYDEEIARLEWSRQFPISILMADVDNLKEVNDKSGHNIGDELLRQVTQVLKASFRAEDVIARIGGDEFAILLPGVNATESKKAIRRIKDSIEKHNAVPDCLPISLSLGASTAETRNSLAEALKKADNDMYREKQSKE